MTTWGVHDRTDVEYVWSWHALVEAGDRFVFRFGVEGIARAPAPYPTLGVAFRF